LVGEKKVLALEGGLFLHRATADEAGQRIVDLLAEHHRRAAASPGMTPDQLREALPRQKQARDAIVKLLLDGGRIVEREGRFALPEHRPSFSAEDAARLEAIEEQFRRRLFNPPSATELAEATGLQPAVVERLLKVLCDNGRLASAEGTLFHCQAVEEARRRLIEHIRREGCLESVRFKYLLDTTRKYALPLLDHFDRIGLLRRVGNTRYLKAPP
jgi:selenocysteine-specific elongation factor